MPSSNEGIRLLHAVLVATALASCASVEDEAAPESVRPTDPTEVTPSQPRDDVSAPSQVAPVTSSVPSDAGSPGSTAPVPGATWPDEDTTGWDATKLAAAKAYAQALNPLGLMIVHRGRVVARLGATTTKTRLHSVRKSLLSVLFGTAVAAGTVDLDATIGSLGIDDTAPALTATEKTATVRHLLQARSGVYHDAAYETAAMEASRPARGSHAPGTFWHYNNWDFNAAGTIYAQRSGESVARGFATRIAQPIEMEDFLESDVRLVYEASSVHPAYTFEMTTRDMARVGLLLLNRGAWRGRQVIPASWVAESTKTWTPDADGSMGYGYMWWTMPTKVGSSSPVGSQDIGPSAFTAAGVGGQRVAVIPERGLVLALTVDNQANTDGIPRSQFYEVLAMFVAAMP